MNKIIITLLLIFTANTVYAQDFSKEMEKFLKNKVNKAEQVAKEKAKKQLEKKNNENATKTIDGNTNGTENNKTVTNGNTEGSSVIENVTAKDTIPVLTAKDSLEIQKSRVLILSTTIDTNALNKLDLEAANHIYTG